MTSTEILPEVQILETMEQSCQVNPMSLLQKEEQTDVKQEA